MPGVTRGAAMAIWPLNFRATKADPAEVGRTLRKGLFHERILCVHHPLEAPTQLAR